MTLEDEKKDVPFLSFLSEDAQFLPAIIEVTLSTCPK